MKTKKRKTTNQVVSKQEKPIILGKMLFYTLLFILGVLTLIYMFKLLPDLFSDSGTKMLNFFLSIIGLAILVRLSIYTRFTNYNGETTIIFLFTTGSIIFLLSFLFIIIKGFKNVSIIMWFIFITDFIILFIFVVVCLLCFFGGKIEDNKPDI